MNSRQTLAVYRVTIALLQSGLYFAFFQTTGMGGAFTLTRESALIFGSRVGEGHLRIA